MWKEGELLEDDPDVALLGGDELAPGDGVALDADGALVESL